MEACEIYHHRFEFAKLFRIPYDFIRILKVLESRNTCLAVAFS